MYPNLVQNGVVYVRHIRNKRNTKIGRFLENLYCGLKDLMSAR